MTIKPILKPGLNLTLKPILPQKTYEQVTDQLYLNYISRKKGYTKSQLFNTTGDNITQWTDIQSGHNATQATGIQQPLYNATGINGKPSATFDGSNDVLATPSIPIAQDVTVFAVVKPTAPNAGAAKTIVQLQNLNTILISFAANKFYFNGILPAWQTISIDNVIVGKLYIIAGTYHYNGGGSNTQTAKMYINNVLQATVTGQNVLGDISGNNSVFIGNGGAAFPGEQGAISWYNKILSADELTQNYNYYLQQYS